MDTSTRRLHAVKIMPFSDATPSKFKNAIQQEVRTHRRISSPYVCELHDVVMDGKRIYLILDNCEGGNLLTMILEGRITSMSELKRIFRQIVLGVQYLHQQNIAHGDIKPENVVFTAEGAVKLIDFGYAKDKRVGTDEDKSGTLWYAAPEMLTLGKYDTHMADVWSLGILLCVTAMSRFPYRALTEDVLRKEIQAGALIIDSDIDPAILALFRKMTQSDPSMRPSIEEVLSSSWLSERIPTGVAHSPTLNLLFKNSKRVGR
jgi:serine/threonine kinase 33